MVVGGLFGIVLGSSVLTEDDNESDFIAQDLLKLSVVRNPPTREEWVISPVVSVWWFNRRDGTLG